MKHRIDFHFAYLLKLLVCQFHTSTDITSHQNTTQKSIKTEIISTIWTALDPSSNITGTPHGDNIWLYPILHPHITGWPEKAAAMAGCMNIE